MAPVDLSETVELTNGKHSGKTYLQVYTDHTPYCRWILENNPRGFESFYKFLSKPERKEKIMTTMQFGKYKGMLYQEILNSDTKYCIYVINNYHRNKFVKDFATWIFITNPKELETEIKKSEKKSLKRFRDRMDELDRL
jgi:hypothetical protein